jgi:indolepyruvate ferredoxin oxidoreductase, alpha subunit
MEEITGLEAIKWAVRDGSVSLITWVPGYPITEIAESLGAKIAVNEKVAMEMALGASATGARSMVIVKQVGMNVLADPLIISATHTIGSGLVVLAGDDLGPKGSQAEMDSRFFGPLAKLPVLDPKDPPALYSSIREAYQLSESLRIPIIVRVTKRLISSQGRALPSLPSRGSGQEFEKNVWDLTARARQQRHHQEVMALAEEASQATLLNRIQISGHIGIVASGYPAKLAEDLGVSILSLGFTYPLPWKLILRFVEGHRLILVAEEPEPFIEYQLRISPKVRGKLTGHLPFGLLERSDIIRALEGLEKNPDSVIPIYENAAERGFPGICDNCPFIPIFRALGKLDVPVAGDAGCAIRATRRPYESVDMVYGLGSSIGVASGFGKKGIAIIGDFALAHTGLQGLINAVWQEKEVLVVLLQNGVAATTGGQEAPDLTKLLEILVPTRALELNDSEECIEKVLREELARPGVSALVATGNAPKCIKDR